jgi:hypothetical protein
MYLFCLVMELSPEEKKKTETALCAKRNDAVSRHLFSVDTPSPNKKKINSFLNEAKIE